MSLEEKIDEIIRSLIDDFTQYPDKYLTESDVRCFLFNQLMQLPEFATLQDTSDGSKSTAIHTEVRWYGKSHKLRLRSDVVILNVADLQVKDGYLKLPSKSFGFNKPQAIIEIKLRRVNGESDNAFTKKIQEDIDKLKVIKEEVASEYPCFLIILDKLKDIHNNIPHSTEIEIFYKHSIFNTVADNNREVSQRLKS
ncbi:hypothetical protein KJ766_02805 [Patescibacteria group bacterium]|nr:hypothetical protein [Patescibacteria group bacterium]